MARACGMSGCFLADTQLMFLECFPITSVYELCSIQYCASSDRN